VTAKDAAIALFRERYGEEPDLIVRSPGRVNLIGEHTDYNEGFVLPMAITLSTWAAVAASGDDTVNLASVGHDDATFSLNDLMSSDRSWSAYVRGSAWVTGAPETAGWNGAFATDIPIGAGLSSSAALEIAALRIFAAMSDRAWDPVQAARDARSIENDWMGLGSGIMDQLIVATARERHATLIDCRDLTTKPIRVPDDIAIVILDTGTRRRLVESSYDERRSACIRAAAAAGVPALRDLGGDDLETLARVVDERTLARARHVITENMRTLEAAEALAANDLRRFGRLVNASHTSLRHDFAVSSPALDHMVELASGTEGCLGARMTGAGFGGCAVAFVEPDAVDDMVTEVTTRYRDAAFGIPSAYVTTPASAATVETP